MLNIWACLLTRTSPVVSCTSLISASKISMSIGIIARIRHPVALHTLPHIYRSLLQPYLLYGIQYDRMYFVVSCLDLLRFSLVDL